MALVINTNIASLNAQRNLSKSQSGLATTLQRLSSGLRINSARDDAAGMAIASRFTTQIRGLSQAVRNANDGISLAQTSEGAVDEITQNLQRIRELAVQSANSTNSSSDRAALNQEVQQRLAEIDRIASQTSFNGQKVLDGTFGTATFQVGANVGETLTIGFSTSLRSTAIGQVAQATSSSEVSTTALSGTGTIQVGSNTAVTIQASTAGTAAGQSVGSAYSKAASINASGVSGLTVTASNTVALTVASVSASNTDTYQLVINGQTIMNSTFTATDANAVTAQQLADAINANATDTGVTAALSGTDLLLTAADGRDIAIGQTLSGATGGISDGGGDVAVNGVTYYDGTIGTAANATDGSTNAAAVNGGRLTFTANEDIVITGGGTDMGLAAANTTIALDTTTISQVDVLTVAAANDTIYRIDSALTTVNNLRGTFGAIQNRFESTIASLSASVENLSAARGRIEDADFASETANLTKSLILQQAGISVLSQANTLPQSVLALLQQ